MRVLQFMYARRQRSRSIITTNFAPRLEEVSALVVLLVHQVDRDATFAFASGQHGAMHPIPIHALTAKLGKQGGMDVHHATCKSEHEIRGNQA